MSRFFSLAFLLLLMGTYAANSQSRLCADNIEPDCLVSAIVAEIETLPTQDRQDFLIVMIPALYQIWMEDLAFDLFRRHQSVLGYYQMTRIATQFYRQNQTDIADAYYLTAKDQIALPDYVYLGLGRYLSMAKELLLSDQTDKAFEMLQTGLNLVPREPNSPDLFRHLSEVLQLQRQQGWLDQMHVSYDVLLWGISDPVQQTLSPEDAAVAARRLAFYGFEEQGYYIFEVLRDLLQSGAIPANEEVIETVIIQAHFAGFPDIRDQIMTEYGETPDSLRLLELKINQLVSEMNDIETGMSAESAFWIADAMALSPDPNIQSRYASLMARALYVGGEFELADKMLAMIDDPAKRTQARLQAVSYPLEAENITAAIEWLDREKWEFDRDLSDYEMRATGYPMARIVGALSEHGHPDVASRYAEYVFDYFTGSGDLDADEDWVIGMLARTGPADLFSRIDAVSTPETIFGNYHRAAMALMEFGTTYEILPIIERLENIRGQQLSDGLISETVGYEMRKQLDALYNILVQKSVDDGDISLAEELMLMIADPDLAQRSSGAIGMYYARQQDIEAAQPYLQIMLEGATRESAFIRVIRYRDILFALTGQGL